MMWSDVSNMVNPSYWLYPLVIDYPYISNLNYQQKYVIIYKTKIFLVIYLLLELTWKLTLH